VACPRRRRGILPRRIEAAGRRFYGRSDFGQI
jgi:hypothetical protein